MKKLDQQKMVLMWNQFIWLFEQLEIQWKKILEEVEETANEKDQYQLLPIPVQKGLAMFGRSSFTIMLSRFIDYYRMSGGTGGMKVDIRKEKEHARGQE